MSSPRNSPETTSSQETVVQTRKDNQQKHLGAEETPEPQPPTTPSISPSSSPRIPKRPHPTVESDSDTDTEAKTMPSGSSKHHSSSSSKKHSSSSSKSKSKSDDWTDVTEPEERRRIQNRIAQRKFREKTKEQKEKAERDSRNQQHAGSSYHIPDSDDIGGEDVEGLPWGGISMRHVVSRGHESESRRGSGRDDSYTHDDGGQYYGQYGGDVYATQSYGSHDSGDYYDDSSLYYQDFGSSGGDGSRS